MIKNRLFNVVMVSGNKFKSERLMRKSLKKIQKKERMKDFTELFKNSIINSSPIFYLKKVRRKRRKSIEFPFMLKKSLRVNYGLKFAVHYCKKIKSLNFYEKFCGELIRSCQKSSKSFEKIGNIHKEAFAKKKVSNYRWF